MDKNMSIQAEKEGIPCGGIEDDESTCNEEIKRTQNFCQACGKKIDKQRFRLEICSSCQCVLTSGSISCHQCGTKTEGLGIKCTEENEADGVKQLSLGNEKEVQSQTATGASNVIPEPKELSEKQEIDTTFGLGLSAEESKGLETAIRAGVSTLYKYIKDRNNMWKDIALNIAVTGNSGVGKSSFINAIRGVKRGENSYAKTGVTETTTECKGYPHPQNKRLIFWDMPGVGTPTYLKDDYLKKVHFEKYDFFLILSNTRFTENDLWLANEIGKQEKAFYFIRTKIVNDVDNTRAENPNCLEIDVIADIEKHSIDQLKNAKFEEPSVFLIDSYRPAKYQFGELVNKILKDLPDKKRDSLALSITCMTKEVIMAKKSALQKRIRFVSIGSALGAAIPLPGVGAVVDTAILLGEAEEYKRQLGIDDESLLKYNTNHARLIGENIAQNIANLLTAVLANEAVEEAAKFSIPVFGSVVSGTVSYGTSVIQLSRLLNSMVDDALKLNKDTIDCAMLLKRLVRNFCRVT